MAIRIVIRWARSGGDEALALGDIWALGYDVEA